MTTTTQTAKVAAALVNGAELTAKQISARYGVKNVRAVISKLRSEGYAIYLNNRVSSYDGETYRKYMIGTTYQGGSCSWICGIALNVMSNG